MGTTLVVNPGSSSKKYALYKEGHAILELSFESSDAGYEVCTQKQSTRQLCESITQADFQIAFARVAATVKQYLDAEKITLDSISVRVVAPGTVFQRHTVIDDAYAALLRSKELSAPLHIPNILKEIQSCHEHFAGVRIIAASDSAFHASLPFVAREFSLQREDALGLDIHRFGFHGLSVASVANRVHSVTGKESERLVICHIGNGVSVTAVKKGKSVDTTMGYSPVSGIPMGSRASDLDPGALLEIMRVKNMRPSEANVYLHTCGGLSGIAGDGDIRRLLDRRSHGDENADKALNLFRYRIQTAIMAATVPLGGLDTLVFTGTAGFRSAELRLLIAKDLAFFGIRIDDTRNDVLVGKEGVISAHSEEIKVVVMRTDEMREMARVADQLDLA
jgi:acetate kinase